MKLPNRFKNLKFKKGSEKGSVTLFVLIAMLFFLAIGMMIFIINMNTGLSQKKDVEKIQTEYNKDVSTSDLDQAYQEAKEKQLGSFFIKLIDQFKQIYNSGEWINEQWLDSNNNRLPLTIEPNFPAGVTKIDVTVTDDLSGGSVKIKDTDTVKQMVIGNENTTTHKLTDEGQYTITNNVDNTNEIKVKIDVTDPIVSNIPGGEVWIVPDGTDVNLDITVSANDPACANGKTGSGMSQGKIEYVISSTALDANTTGTIVNGGTAQVKAESSLGEGDYYIYARATDLAGNVSEWKQSEVIHVRTANYEIKTGTDTRYAETLADAITRAKAASTTTESIIKVLRSVEDSSEATIDKNITLDTNGKTLTMANTITVANGAIATFTGTGTIQRNVADGEWGFLINNNGKTIVGVENAENGPTLTSKDRVINGGTVEVYSGNIASQGQSATIDSAGIYSKIINVYGGNITNDNGYYGIIMYVDGICNVTGGKVSGRTAICPQNGTLNIGGDAKINGRVHAIGSAAPTHSYTLKVTGGEITGESNNAINATADNTNITITGGTFTGAIYGISMTGANSTLTIGDNTNALNKTTPVITGTSGKSVNITGATSTFNFYDGKLIGGTKGDRKIDNRDMSFNIANDTTFNPYSGHRPYTREKKDKNNVTYYETVLEKQVNVKFEPNPNGNEGATVSENSRKVLTNVEYKEKAEDASIVNLPTPTRTGYTFKGWNGKNQFDKSKYLHLEDYTIWRNPYMGAEIRLKPNTVYKVSVKRYNNFDGRDNGYLFISDVDTINGYTWTSVAHNTAGDYSAVNYTYTTGEDGLLYIGYTSMTQEKLNNIWANTDVQIEEGSTATAYEPYYIEDNTKVVQDRDHTLNAVWEATPYTVTADANGGSIPATEGWKGTGDTATKSVTFDSQYGALPTPTRVGYDFQNWTGKNLLNLSGRTEKNIGQWENTNKRNFTGNGIYKGLATNNYYYPSNANYQIDENNNTVKVTSMNDGYGVGFDVRVKPNTQYTLNNNENIVAGALYKQDGTWIGRVSDTFTTTADSYWLVIIVASIRNTENLVSNIQLEEGSTATNFEPYKVIDANTTVSSAADHTIHANWTPRTDTPYVVNHYVHDLGATTYTLKSELTDNLQGTSDATLQINNLKKTIAGYTFEDAYTTGDTTKPADGAVTETTISADGTRVINMYYRPNYLYVQYHVNTGSLAENHGSSFGVSDSLITYTGNTASTEFLMGVYGSKVGQFSQASLASYTVVYPGLHYYNNPSGINIEKTGYSAKSSAEWNTSADGTGTSYNHSETQYNATDMATACGKDLSTGDQVITLYVNWETIPYTISYELNKGKNNSSNPTGYTIETENITLQNPTRNGYIFIGWTGSNGDTPQTTVTIPKGSTGDRTYTANWEEKTYTLTIKPNGGAVDGSTTDVVRNLKYSDVSNINDPTRIGYSFGGYNELSGAAYNNGLAKVVVYNNANNGVVTVTSQAKSADNPITGMSNELKISNSGTAGTWPGLGGFLHSKTVTANGKYVHVFVAKLPEGYYFHNAYNSLGTGATTQWLTSNEGTGKWQTYIYQVNAGTGSSLSNFGYIYVSTDKNKVWGNTGNSATGAYTAYLAYSNIYDITSDDSGIGQIDGTGVLTAKWAANNYTIHFNANGGTGEMVDESMVYDQEKALTKNTFTKTGYEFQGWALSDNGNAEYDDEQVVKNLTAEKNGEVTLYANWEANSYTVTADANGGTISTAEGWDTTGEKPTKSVTYDSAYGTLPTASRTGYTFKGWKVNNEGDLINASTIVTTASNHDIDAIWDANHYKVHFDKNDEGATGTMSDQAFTYDQAQNLTANGFSKTGYTFAGWATSANGAVAYTNSQEVSNLTATNNGTVNLYAKWTANTYSIRFNKNNNSATGSMDNQSMTYETAANLTNNGFALTGHHFEKWTTNSDGTGTQYSNGQSVNNLTAENGAVVDLYAQWTPNPYTVTLNAGDGTIDAGDDGWDRAGDNKTATKDITYDSDYGTLPNASRTGYTFNGWFTAAEGGTQITASTTMQTASDISLYPHWTPNQYTVIADADGGSIPATDNWTGTGASATKPVTFDSTYGGLPTPTRAGYEFQGWKINGTGDFITSSTQVTTAANHTIKAIWLDVTKPTWIVKLLTITP